MLCSCPPANAQQPLTPWGLPPTKPLQKQKQLSPIVPLKKKQFRKAKTISPITGGPRSGARRRPNAYGAGRSRSRSDPYGSKIDPKLRKFR